MTREPAYAKINLALVVGPRRSDGLHQVATVLERVSLHDDVELEAASSLTVEGFADDTLVRCALEALASTARTMPRWRARIEKRIPVASGLGGGSSDAAAALRLANAALERPLAQTTLHGIAAGLGADVPFFLRAGPQLATGAGAALSPLALPTGYSALLVLPKGSEKASTAAVYDEFDQRGGGSAFAERAAALRTALERIREPADLAALPANDLASSPVAATLRELGAFRADVSGAGPAVYGLFPTRSAAERAEGEVQDLGRTWVTEPVAGP